MRARPRWGDDVWGEVGVACVTCKKGQSLTPEGVRQFCEKGLAKYKLPKHILILESLPLTSLGKIDKPRLRRELIANGKFTD
jgi:fatty-acyl-CoA synthase